MKSFEETLPKGQRRPLSREDAVTAYEHFARRAVEIFNTEGEIQPQLFFVALDDSVPRNIAFVKALEPDAVTHFENSDEGRARRFQLIADSFVSGSDIAEALKRQGMPMVPDFVAQVAEVSLHTGGAGDMPTTDDKSVRHDAVLVVIFTSTRQYAGVCFVHENPRRCVYSALEDEMLVGLREAPVEQAADDGEDEHNSDAPDDPQNIS
jgi:hypothetical protein